MFEIGASFIISQNLNILEIIRDLDLTAVTLANLKDKKLGIFDTDSSQFVFKESDYKFLSLLKMFWKFGPYAMWKLQSVAKTKLE